MTGETDLSTADLARPGGPGQSDRGDADARTGERAHEVAGNRVVQGPGDQGPADEDTVESTGAAPSTGSTRDDARDRNAADRGVADQDTADHGMGDRGMADRDTADRGMTGPGTARRDDAGTGEDVALLDPRDAEELRRRWSDTQTRFVDDPREAVQTADGLVGELMQTLARSFSARKDELEGHWRSGGDPDTEELRQALQRYRSFFDRLLSA